MHLTNNSRFGVWPSGTPPVEHPMPPKEVRFREREIRFKNDLARFHCFAETAGAGLDCNRRTLCAKGSTLSRLLA
jgi:hypothetical protein